MTNTVFESTRGKYVPASLNYLEPHMAPDHRNDGGFMARCRCAHWRDGEVCCLMRRRLAVSAPSPKPNA